MRKLFGVLGLLVVFALSAYGQEAILRVDIPFAFVAAGKTVPAGSYEFTTTTNLNGVIMRNTKTKETLVLPVMTRLAADSSGTVRVTFDEMGVKKFLEAVWPGSRDGYLLHQTKEKHTHSTVKGG